MAEVTIQLPDDICSIENEAELDIVLKFLDKWKSILQDFTEEEFLVDKDYFTDSEGKKWALIDFFKDYGAGEKNANRSISTSDKDSLSQIILRFFSPPSSLGFSLGVDSLPVEFYKELFELIEMPDVHMLVNVDSDSGTYSCWGEPTENGLEWEANYYEDED